MQGAHLLQSDALLELACFVFLFFFNDSFASSSLCHNHMLQELQMDCGKMQFYWHTWQQEGWWPLHPEVSLPLPGAEWSNKDDVLTSSDCSLVCTGEDLLPTVSRWQGKVSPDTAKVICKASNGSSLKPQSQLKVGGRV